MSKKTQLIVLGVLLAVLAVVVFRVLYQRPSAPAVSSSDPAKYSPLGVENAALHWWRLDQARKTEYSKGERNIFSFYVPPPPPPRPAPAAASSAPAIPPPPPPLVLPAKYFGYSSVPGTGQRRAFLTNGEDVFILGEGEILLGQFRILHIGNTTLDFEEISSKRRGTVALEPEESPS